MHLTHEIPSVGRVIDAHGPAALAYLRAHLPDNPDDAEELYQDWCEKLIRALPRFRGDCTLKTYVFVVARNVLVDFVRRRNARGHETRLRTSLLSCLTDASICPQDVSSELLLLDRNRHHLTQGEWTLVCLHFTGFTWSEVAAYLERTGDGVHSEAALRQRFSRLCKRLRHAEAVG